MKMSMFIFEICFCEIIYYRSSDIILQQKDIEREWLENNNEIM